MFGFGSTVVPTLPSIGLSEGERAIITDLERMGSQSDADSELCRAFYLGQQVIKNLRIAVPKELEAHLTTVVGWGAAAVDPLVERSSLDGFRTPDGDDADSYIGELMETTGFEAELPMALTDAFSMGRGFITVGSPAERGGPPVVTADNPANMYVKWDARGRVARQVLHKYSDGQQQRATLMLPNLSLHLAVNDKQQWEVVQRDEHDFDFIGLTRLSNMSLTDARQGRSEITPALRSIIIDACRTLRSLVVAGEIYSVPQRLILGATEEAFQNANGTTKTALETYITSILALERDENGELPDVKQMAVYDPSVFTRVVEMYASQASGILAATPQELGLYTDGNPVSAESVKASRLSRDDRARLRQRFCNPALAQVAQHMIRFDNGGTLPEQYRRLTADWNPVAVETIGVTSDAISKQIQVGAIPATSDVTLKRLGYTAPERRRLEADRRRERVTLAATAARESIQGAANAGGV